MLLADGWGNLHIIFNSIVSSLIKVSRETFDSHTHPSLTPPGWSWTCPSWACTAGWGPAVRRGRGRWRRRGAARSARAARSGTQSWSPSATSSSPSTGGQTHQLSGSLGYCWYLLAMYSRKILLGTVFYCLWIIPRKKKLFAMTKDECINSLPSFSTINKITAHK